MWLHAIHFPVPENPHRARFGLPEDRFLFLTMYDMHSLQERKNPEASLDAFTKAFPDVERSGVGLVIKLMNGGTYPEDYAALKQRLASVSGTHLIDETLAREEVYELEACCDAFVSLHRSEGFGLGLAECMFLGKPVVGTNWSGNVDFMTSAYSCPVDFSLVELDRDHGPYRKGQHWAEPDVDHASHYMRKLATDDAYRKEVGQRGQQTIRLQHSPGVIGERYRRRLRMIAQML